MARTKSKVEEPTKLNINEKLSNFLKENAKDMIENLSIDQS